MTAYVVDENVAIVANDASRSKLKTPQADVQCRLSCVRALKTAVKSGLIIIDDQGEVLAKYHRHLDRRGQPGIGDAFYKHLCDRQFDRRRVRRANVAKDQDGSLKLFPDDPDLKTFDPDDRVFVVLALVAKEKPTILNAVDRDYSIHKAALLRAGAKVRELCQHCIVLRKND